MAWNKFDLLADTVVAPSSRVAAVSRIPNSMETWCIGANGSVKDAFWYDGAGWQDFELAPARSAATTGGIAAVSRIPGSMELWFVGVGGSIEDAYWYEGASWQRFQLAPPESASLQGGIAAVSRVPNSMELWWIGMDGSVQGAFWYEGGSWQTYPLAPPGSASLSSGIAAVSRVPNSMELWWIGPEGSVEGAFWYEGSTWQRYQLRGIGSASLTSNIAAVSRIPTSMELWFVSPDGAVEDSYWYEGAAWQHFTLAGLGSASTSGGLAAVSRVPESMELWYVGSRGSIEDAYWYDGAGWQQFTLEPDNTASLQGGIAVTSRIPASMELWTVGAGGALHDDYWYQDPSQLPTLSSANNNLLINGCANLQNVSVSLSVSQDLVTYQDAGFSLQLNAYPPAGQLSQGQTLNWLQYILYVQSGTLYYEIQYWAIGAPSSWPPGYTPVPNTTPWLPVFPNDYFLTPFGSAPSNRIARGSLISINLTTDTTGNVTNAYFGVVDSSGNQSSANFPFPAGTQYPISAFEVNLVGPGNFSNATFISGAGTLLYTLSPGSFSVQSGGPGSACAEVSAGTGEGSNVVYGPMTPSSGSAVTQSVSFVWQGTAAASGSALHGYWGTDASQHVNFVALDGHVHELYIRPGAAWLDNDLTALGNGTPAAPGSALTGYWGSDDSQHVNFISLDGHVHELYIHPGAGWVDNDLTAFANATPAAPGSALDGYWGSDDSQHVNFVSADGHVHELYIQPGAAWVDNDLTAFTGAPLAAVGTELDAYWGADDSQHVNYMSLDGHVHELYIHPGAGWTHYDLTAASNGTPAAVTRLEPRGRFHSVASGSALDGYWGSDNSQHVNFVDMAGHVHELYIHPGAGWVDNDLTAFTQGVLAMPGSALNGYWGSDDSQHVNFIGVDGHVHELYIRPGAGWVDNDLTAMARAMTPAPGSALDGYWGSDNSQHVNFLSVDGHVHELYIAPGEGWVDNDLSAFT